jgi:hypothetical protein
MNYVKKRKSNKIVLDTLEQEPVAQTQNTSPVAIATQESLTQLTKSYDAIAHGNFKDLNSYYADLRRERAKKLA